MSNWVTDINAAAARANSEQKLLYLHIGRATCGNCVAMKRYYPNLDFSRFVLVDVNCDTDRSYSSRYNIRGGGLPFIVIAKADNAVLFKSDGYKDEKTIRAALAAANINSTPIEGKAAALAPPSATGARPALGTATGNQNLTPGSAEDLKAGLDRHNMLRALHGAPPLAYSAECARTAQVWANTMAQQNRMYHGGHDGMGQNLAMSTGSLDCDDSVDMWYNEIEEYDYSSPDFKSGTGHFTQVVWLTTTHVGFGVARAANGSHFICANYSPAGNYMGQFASKVPRLLTDHSGDHKSALPAKPLFGRGDQEHNHTNDHPPAGTPTSSESKSQQHSTGAGSQVTTTTTVEIHGHQKKTIVVTVTRTGNSTMTSTRTMIEYV